MHWNFLLLDDIVETAQEIEEQLRELVTKGGNSCSIETFLYDVKKPVAENARIIEKKIIEKGIQVLALDRQYSEKVHDGNVYYASGATGRKVKADMFLAGQDSILVRLAQDPDCRLEKIFIYSYERDPGVITELEELKLIIRGILPRVSVWTRECNLNCVSWVL